MAPAKPKDHLVDLKFKLAIGQKILLVIWIIAGTLVIGSFLMAIVMNLATLGKPTFNLTPVIERSLEDKK